MACFLILSLDFFSCSLVLLFVPRTQTYCRHRLLYYLMSSPHHKQLPFLTFPHQNNLGSPSPAHCHALWSVKDAPRWSSVHAKSQQRWGQRSLVSPNSLCREDIRFSVLLFSWKWKNFWILLPHASGFFSSVKSKFRPEFKEPFFLGVVILRRACLALNDFGSNMRTVFSKHKSHANHTHPVDVYIQRPASFQNV